MKNKLKIGVIGLGNMGKTLACALSIRNSYRLFVYDKIKSKKKHISGCFTTKNLKELLTKSEIIILAIKPQDVEEFLIKYREYIDSKQLFVSIAAGIPMKFYKKYLKTVRIIRVMPNLAASIGESVSFISKGKYITNRDLSIVKEIFSCVGKVIAIDESYLDKVTSLSGSGPGYVFYFMESMYKSALKLGFEKRQAKDMVIQVFLGAAKLAKNSGKDFQCLKNAVASKGGTTEAAFSVFKDKKIDTIIERGIKNAQNRAKTISCKLLKRKRR